MMMPPVARGVLDVDEEERDEEDLTLSIRRASNTAAPAGK
jgi:hypothetical protein